MTTAKLEAVTADKKIDRLLNTIDKFSGFLHDYQLESIHENMPIIFDSSKPAEEQKDAALSIWCAFEDSQRVDFCGWAWVEHLFFSLPKPVFSSVLIATHQRGKTKSLLTNFPLNERIQMFELADPQHLMSASEYERFLALPEEVKIYRGGSGMTATKLKYGMSWTTDVDLAAWFADRFTHSRGTPIVIEGIAKKQNILGSFDYEDEIITIGARISKMKVLGIDIEAAASRHGEKMQAEREAEKEKLEKIAA
jgi:hypothetical protein